MAKLFSQRPSDVAVLDDCVGEFGTFYFNRGIAAFGRAVAARLDEVSKTNNKAIAQAAREREWARLMGEDMTNSPVGFRDPGEGLSAHGRSLGGADVDDDEIVLDGSW